MKHAATLVHAGVIVALMLVAAGGATAHGGPSPAAVAVDPSFTYQGRLLSGGLPIDAVCDFQASLWDAAASGGQLGAAQSLAGVPVAGGYFTLRLNSGGEFGGSAFNGQARWLQVAVQCPGDGGFTTLSRQPLTPVPYAHYALAAPWGGLTDVPAGFADGLDDVGWSLGGNAGTGPANVLGTTDAMTLTLVVNNTTALRLARSPLTPNVLGGHAVNSVISGVYGATIGGGGAAAFPNRVADAGGTIGGGIDNLAGSDDAVLNNHTYATVGGGRGNIASAYAGTVSGGYSNTLTFNYATIAGGRYNVAGDFFVTIGGGDSNSALDNYATVSGGYSNTASADAAVIGGGYLNLTGLNAFSATIGGGHANVIGDEAATATIGGGAYNAVENFATNGTIAGGSGNYVSGPSASVGGGWINAAFGQDSVVAGGSLNQAAGFRATVGGGFDNQANGDYAAVPGGGGNRAEGEFSFAAGASASALHDGAFVWADSAGAGIASTTDDQFLVRASGGITLYTDAAATVGAALMPGDSAWTVVSDRRAKTNVAPVDGIAVLRALADIPIATWSYAAQGPAVVHMGPMAQDFYAAFGLGATSTGITTVDADGVALAAIQGLYAIVQARDAEIAELKAAQAGTETRLAALEARLAALEARPALPGLLLGALALLNLGAAAGWLLARRRR